MKAVLFFVLLMPILLLAQEGSKTQQGKLYGIWQNSQFGYQMTLILNEDGNGEFDGELIKFVNQGAKLSITQGGEITVYSYSFQGNSLTLSGGDLDQAILFSRNGIQGPAAISVTDSNVGPENISTTDTGVVGVWSGSGETIEFKQDGTCLYNRNTFTYQASKGQLILLTAQGNVTFPYEIKGKQLILTANGRQVTYMRGATNTASVAGNANSGNVAQELVGKWCWTNVNKTNTGGSSSSECILLNANGTYEYASERSMDANTNSFYAGTSSQGSDQGTWWVQGEKIFYNSPTRGQGSYQLQKQNHPKTGDPMILLNGEPYVTFYQKQPWR